MMRPRRWMAAFAALFLLSACMQDLFDARKGRVAIAVKWPVKAAYGLLAIPEGTARIDVTVLGEGLENAPIKAQVTPKDGTETASEVLDVPIGPKVVQATSFDARGRATATGYKTLLIEANKLSEAVVTLTALPDGGTEPGEVPGGTPSPSPGENVTIDTVAGTGKEGSSDGGDPLTASFKYPQSLVYDPKSHSIFIADTDARLIRRFNLTTLAVTTLAGTRPATLPATGAKAATAAPVLGTNALGVPAGLAMGPDGALYFADKTNHLVRRLGLDGTLTTIAGNGRAGDGPDGAEPLSTSLHYPSGVAFDRRGALYIADLFNHKVRRLGPDGRLTTFAGTGLAGESGDGGLAERAQIYYPTAIAIDPAGDALYIAEGSQPRGREGRGVRVRSVRLGSGLIDTVVGTGAEGVAGENGPAAQAELSLPTALAFTQVGELLIADGWALGPDQATMLGSSSRVLKLTSDGRLMRLAGQAGLTPGYGGDAGPARAATLNNPAGLAIDAQGRIYIADSYNNRIRALSAPSVLPSPAPSPAASPSASPAPSPIPSASPTSAP